MTGVYMMNIPERSLGLAALSIQPGETASSKEKGRGGMFAIEKATVRQGEDRNAKQHDSTGSTAS